MSTEVTEATTTQVTDPSQRPAQLDYILMDGSGSMCSKREDSFSAIDNYVAQLRLDNISCPVHVSIFSSSIGLDYIKVRQQTPQDWSDLRPDSEITFPGGSTPLNDSINVMCRELRGLMPQKCSILIITDGDENSSKTTTEQACALLNWCRGMGWQVTFLGCDYENSRQAKLLGASEANTLGVNIKRLTDATSLLAEKRSRYALYGTDMDMSKDEKTELGGLLPKPEHEGASK